MRNIYFTFFFLFLSFVIEAPAQIIFPPKILISGVMEYDPQHRRTNFPYISGETFRAMADFVVDETHLPFDIEKVENGSIIFITYPYLSFFIEEILPHIRKHFILITHNGDGFNPVAVFRELVENPYLEYWFGRDINSSWHSKLKPIPLGIVSRPDYLHKRRHKIYNNIQNQAHEKNKLLYMNFMIHTCKTQRKPIFDLFYGKPFVTFSEPTKPLKDFLHDLASSHFVLCPRGSNLDSFRTWETLLCGSYPIIQHSYLDELYTDLPILLVDDWNEITEEFLLEKLEEFSKKRFNLKKTYGTYWINEINSYKDKIRKKYEENQ